MPCIPFYLHGLFLKVFRHIACAATGDLHRWRYVEAALDIAPNGTDANIAGG